MACAGQAQGQLPARDGNELNGARRHGGPLLAGAGPRVREGLACPLVHLARSGELLVRVLGQPLPLVCAGHRRLPPVRVPALLAAQRPFLECGEGAFQPPDNRGGLGEVRLRLGQGLLEALLRAGLGLRREGRLVQPSGLRQHLPLRPGIGEEASDDGPQVLGRDQPGT